MRPAWNRIGVALCGLGLGLSACTLEPVYERPAAPVAAQWPNLSAPAPAPDAPAAADLGWRDFFSDPALQRLITIALANNRDLQVAVLNVETAQAQYRIERAQLLPTVNVGASYTAERTPNGFLEPGEPSIERYQAVTANISSYQIDLFGKIRSLSHAALEQYLGLEETRRSAQLSLVASVADAYFTVLADRELLQITVATEQSEQASLDLTRRTLDFGTGTELSVRQAETALLTARANESAYRRQLAQDTDALVLLLGAPIPDDLPRTPSLADENLTATVPRDVPSAVLVQRPDVLAAERTLRSANADIGAARAAFFPSITLIGDVGFESLQLSQLFKPGTKAWSYMPQVTLPIFTGGANDANLDVAKIQKRIDVANYEKAIQTAFREVADALAGLPTLDDELAAEQQLVVASQRSYDLSTLRFQSGVDNYLSTLDSQRSLYSAQQGLVSVKLARLQNLVATYEALGGGWKEFSAPEHPSAPD